MNYFLYGPSPPYFEAGILTGYVSFISPHTHTDTHSDVHLFYSVEYWLSGTEVEC